MRRAKKKGIEVQRVKPLTPTWAIDGLIRGEEQTGKKKREQREKHGADLQPRPYDPQESYSEPILVLSPPAHMREGK